MMVAVPRLSGSISGGTKMQALSIEQCRPWEKHLVLVMKRVVVRCYVNDALNSVAQVSFYFVLSMFPFFLLIAALLGWVPTSSGWQLFAKWLAAYFPVRTQATLLIIMLGL